jgi:hypothetical protein
MARCPTIRELATLRAESRSGGSIPQTAHRPPFQFEGRGPPHPQARRVLPAAAGSCSLCPLLPGVGRPVWRLRRDLGRPRHTRAQLVFLSLSQPVGVSVPAGHSRKSWRRFFPAGEVCPLGSAGGPPWGFTASLRDYPPRSSRARFAAPLAVLLAAEWFASLTIRGLAPAAQIVGAGLRVLPRRTSLFQSASYEPRTALRSLPGSLESLPCWMLQSPRWRFWLHRSFDRMSAGMS